MELTIVAVYTICDDLLMALGHHTDPQAQMTDAEVMTTAIIAALYIWRQSSNGLSYVKNKRIYPGYIGTLPIQS